MAINFEDIAQRRSEPLGKYTCTFYWEDGDGFCAMMNELPEEVYLDSLGDRIWFTQSPKDKTVYLYKREERLN
jgi:hypothetical protein